MKEVNAVTLMNRAFPANFVASAGSGSFKTAGASFDSFLSTSPGKAEVIKPKAETAQFNVSASETQPSGNVQTKTVQTENGNLQQGAAQTENIVPQTDTVKEIDSVADGTVQTDETIIDETANFNEIITALNQIIQDVVKDVTGIDDEMFSSALSALGFTETDLLDTSNLAKFILFINGSSDMTDLLANEYMMSQFNDISDILKGIDWETFTGMPKEEFMSVLENVVSDDMIGKDATDTSIMGTAQDASVQNTQDTIPVTVEYVEEESASVTKQAEDTNISPAVRETVAEQTGDNTQENTGTISDREGQTVNTDNNTKQSEDFNQSADSQTDRQVTQSAQTDVRTPIHNDVLNGTAGFLQNLNQAVADVVGETVPQQTGMQQMIDIVNQVVEQIKVTLGKETTSMQMQLNPESLGKVLISVSSSHGVMTANFTVQTEEAKEALQSQMYNLREALESRSLKVDAVEVEVSDFAFSQSSQADAQNQKEFEKGNGRRFRFDFEDSSEDEGSTVDTVQSGRRTSGTSLGSSIDFTA